MGFGFFFFTFSPIDANQHEVYHLADSNTCSTAARSKMAPQKRHYVFVKAALDKVKSHPSLGPKVTGRWITSNCLYGLVKIQLAHSPLHELTHIQSSGALIAHPLFDGTINRQNKMVGFYRLDVNRELFYWIGEKPQVPKTSDTRVEEISVGS
jgi:hypothetical protein